MGHSKIGSFLLLLLLVSVIASGAPRTAMVPALSYDDIFHSNKTTDAEAFPRMLTLFEMESISRAIDRRTVGRNPAHFFTSPISINASHRTALQSVNSLVTLLCDLYRCRSLPLSRVLGTTLRTDFASQALSFSHASDLYLALSSLLRSDRTGIFSVVGFKDFFLHPREDGDRYVLALIQRAGQVVSLRFEVDAIVQGRLTLKPKDSQLFRKNVFQNAFLLAERQMSKDRVRLASESRIFRAHVRAQIVATTAAIQKLESARVNSSSGRGLKEDSISSSPDDVLCPNWRNITVDHSMSGADKLRTFLWGVQQPICHPDRIRAGHLLYKNICDAYKDFEWSSDPKQRVQQALLRSVYLSSADYLRARATAPQNQMCSPQEKVRIYRGIGLMPLLRGLKSKNAAHLAPMFGDQLVSGLMMMGLADERHRPKVRDRDLGN